MKTSRDKVIEVLEGFTYNLQKLQMDGWVDDRTDVNEPPDWMVKLSEEIDQLYSAGEEVGKVGQKLGPPVQVKPLRWPDPNEFLKERNRKMHEEDKGWRYDDGWHDCEEWLRLNQKRFDKQFIDEVEAMITRPTVSEEEIEEGLLKMRICLNYGDDSDFSRYYHEDDIKAAIKELLTKTKEL